MQRDLSSLITNSYKLLVSNLIELIVVSAFVPFSQILLLLSNYFKNGFKERNKKKTNLCHHQPP
jgi:hypothetical protein